MSWGSYVTMNWIHPKPPQEKTDHLCVRYFATRMTEYRLRSQAQSTCFSTMSTKPVSNPSMGPATSGQVSSVLASLKKWKRARKRKHRNKHGRICPKTRKNHFRTASLSCIFQHRKFALSCLGRNHSRNLQLFHAYFSCSEYVCQAFSLGQMRVNHLNE